MDAIPPLVVGTLGWYPIGNLTMRRISVVCEGPSDFHVITAALDAIFGGEDYVPTQLQPEGALFGGDAGPHGGGWKGVRNWCQARVVEAGSLSSSSATALTDLLIVHLDADVADDAEVACAKACPPAEHTVNELRQVILGWCGEDATPAKVVLCIPSKATESWVFSGLYPNEADAGIECHPSPAELLLHKTENLVRRRDGRLKKDPSAYRRLAQIITIAWPRIKELCASTAPRFEQEVLAV